MNKDDMQQRVRLIEAKGKQLGIMTFAEARAIAESKRAKLVKIAPTAIPPIYRLVVDEEHQNFEKRWTE